MLKKTPRVTIEGECVVDGKNIARFFTVIDGNNPKMINFSTRPLDVDLCKEHATDVRADETAFQEYSYSMQEKIIAELENN